MRSLKVYGAEDARKRTGPLSGGMEDSGVATGGTILG